MLKLLGRKTSGNVQKVIMALEEIGADYDRQDYGRQFENTQTPEYKALNPTSKVPTLIDGDLVIRESNVILEYLDDAYPDPPLRPADPYGRAKVRVWNQRLAEGHHDIATATLSMGIAFRHQYLAKGEPECGDLVDKVPDPVKRERRRDV